MSDNCYLKGKFTRMRHIVYLTVFLVLAGLQGFGQQRNDSLKIEVGNVVQIAGIVVSGDSLDAVPFADVIVQGNYRGTLCDASGFFSIVAKTGDTLNFNSIGYKMGQYVIPDSLESKQYSLIQILDRDTILLPVTTVKVWPTYDQFKKAFLAVEVPDNDLVRAQKNLDAEGIREKAINLALGSVGNQDLMQQNYNSRLYYAGQVQPNNFLNPIAWAKFIKAWKEGKLGRYR